MTTLFSLFRFILQRYKFGYDFGYKHAIIFDCMRLNKIIIFLKPNVNKHFKYYCI